VKLTAQFQEMSTQLFLSRALDALKILNDRIPDSETTQTNSTVNPHPRSLPPATA
jgi:hypothetical protein